MTTVEQAEHLEEEVSLLLDEELVDPVARSWAYDALSALAELVDRLKVMGA